MAAVPLSDTLKQASSRDASLIERTVPRTDLWRAQTPQGFPREALDRAYHDALSADADATDDAAVFERAGLPVVVVRGSERLLKVTEEPDFARAEAMASLAE